MKKILFFGLVIGLAAVLVYGCSSSSSTSTNKTLDNVTAQSYAQVGSTLAQDITGSMASWAKSGSVTGMSVLNAKGLHASSVTVSPTADANGYYHISGEVTGTVTYGATTYTDTFTIDLYGKVTTNETTGDVTSVSVYGSYSETMSSADTTITYGETFGSGEAAPYVGTVTYSGAAISSITCTGSISVSIASSAPSAGSHHVVMAFTLGDFTVPITSGLDYPSGTITIATTLDGISQPNIVLTFNGTATATMTYGDYSASIIVEAS